MFRFENPEVFSWLIVLPVLLLVALLSRRDRLKKVRSLGDREVIARLLHEYSGYKVSAGWMFILFSVALLIISWANPQWGSRKENVEARRADVIIALDISTSMLAEDVAPNRLIRAKRFTEQLIQNLRGERIGLILFAGNAYLQMPLTADYAAAKMFLQSASPNMATTQGTEISEAIDLAMQVFPQDDESQHALIIISDGENHDDAAVNSASQASERNLLIYTIGVGTPEGSFIPIITGGREDYKRDTQGNPVRSRFDDGLLREIAESGKGKYYYMQDGSSIFQDIREEVRRIERDTLEERSFTDYQSYFQYFLFAALVFLVLEGLVSNRKLKYLRDKDIFQI